MKNKQIKNQISLSLVLTPGQKKIWLKKVDDLSEEKLSKLAGLLDFEKQGVKNILIKKIKNKEVDLSQMEGFLKQTYNKYFKHSEKQESKNKEKYLESLLDQI